MNATRRIRGQTAANPAETAEKAQELLCEFNALPANARTAPALLEKLLGTWNGAVVRAPFHVDLGLNVHFDEGCFVDANCVIHDQAEVLIGSFTQVSTGVKILTCDPENPISPRRIRIGRNVWIGANAVIHPGVTIGDDTIVSAGSVVTTDVPEGATVAGNPAKIIC